MSSRVLPPDSKDASNVAPAINIATSTKQNPASKIKSPHFTSKKWKISGAFEYCNARQPKKSQAPWPHEQAWPGVISPIGHCIIQFQFQNLKAHPVSNPISLSLVSTSVVVLVWAVVLVPATDRFFTDCAALVVERKQWKTASIGTLCRLSICMLCIAMLLCHVLTFFLSWKYEASSKSFDLGAS